MNIVKFHVTVVIYKFSKFPNFFNSVRILFRQINSNLLKKIKTCYRSLLKRHIQQTFRFNYELNNGRLRRNVQTSHMLKIMGTWKVQVFSRYFTLTSRRKNEFHLVNANDMKERRDHDVEFRCNELHASHPSNVQRRHKFIEFSTTMSSR